MRLGELFQGKCQSFNGLASGRCRAGLRYRSVVDGRRLPCLAEDHARTLCPKRHLLSAAEADLAAAGRHAPVKAPARHPAVAGRFFQLEDLFEGR